jgi:hypothetical protein
MVSLLSNGKMPHQWGNYYKVLFNKNRPLIKRISQVAIGSLTFASGYFLYQFFKSTPPVVVTPVTVTPKMIPISITPPPPPLSMNLTFDKTALSPEESSQNAISKLFFTALTIGLGIRIVDVDDLFINFVEMRRVRKALEDIVSEYTDRKGITLDPQLSLSNVASGAGVLFAMIQGGDLDDAKLFAQCLDTIDLEFTYKDQTLRDLLRDQSQKVMNWFEDLAARYEKFGRIVEQEVHDETEKKNAYTKRDDPYYWLTGADIGFITQSPFFVEEFKGFHLIQGQQVDHLKEGDKFKNEVLKFLNKGKPVICSLNLGDYHWSTFCLVKKDDKKVVALYKDSFGSKPPKDFSKLLEENEIELKYHQGNEQRGDGSHCAILTLANEAIFAHGLREKREEFINTFEKQVFCSLEEARRLRRVFGKLYLEGCIQNKNDSLEAGRKARRFSQLQQEQHKDEVLGVIDSLREHIPEGIVLQRGEAEDHEEAKQTIFVQAEREDAEWKRYHYRIESSRDIDNDNFIRILTPWFEAKKLVEGKDKDYHIEGRAVKVLKVDAPANEEPDENEEQGSTSGATLQHPAETKKKN